MKKILFLVITFLIGYNLYAETAGNYLSVKIEKVTRELSNSNLPNQPSRTYFQLNNFLEILQSGNELIKSDGFPLPDGNSITIELSAGRPVFDSRTKWLRNTKNGLVQAEAPNFTAYYGKVPGNEESLVAICIINDELAGTVKLRSGEEYSILSATLNDGSPAYEVAKSQELLGRESVPFICGTPEYDGEEVEIKEFNKQSNEQILKKNLLEAPVAIEGTFDYFTLMGSKYNKAAAYIAAVISHSSRIYEENFNIAFKISYVLIQEDEVTDPYKGTSTLSDKLYVMPSAWTGRNVTRSVAVLFASLYNQPSGTVIAGISMGGQPYKGTLCSTQQGFCVLGIRGTFQYPTIDYTWDINVATHEIGHNFGCPHTHNCYWRPNMIDTCITSSKPYQSSDGCVRSGDPIPRPGTIMSYCHLTNPTHSVELKFHDREKPLIRKAAEIAKCVADYSNPFVSLLNPLGGKTLKALSKENIRWTSSQVEYVAIKYTFNDGASWLTIADNVPASDSIFTWQVPNVSSSKVLVLIQQSGNPKISDTSIVYLSIYPPSIKVSNPVGGDKLGWSDQITGIWMRAFVKNVYVEMTTNSGATWEKKATKLDADTFRIPVPKINADMCRLRVVSEDSASILGYSGYFSIGQEKATIKSPNGGETWCVGYNYNIRWKADFMSKYYLYYSLDNKTTWKKVWVAPFTVKDTLYSWHIPYISGKTIYIGIASVTDTKTMLDICDLPFAIDTCILGTNDEPKELQIKDIRTVELLPNPADNTVKLKVINESYDGKQLELFLSDETGTVIKTLQKTVQLKYGMNIIEQDISGIAGGNYFICLRGMGDAQDCIPLKIVR
ncbi:MAG: Peptidase protein [Ignavibacteria bacterium]|nr:Peptidase protein [Ignavibacteria bacterium]